MTMAGSGETRARPATVLPEDARFMQLAIDEAAKAEIPFGAVIVKDGKVLASGHNRTGLDRDPTAHGEMVVIRAFLSEHGPEALKGTTLYTSGEPCCMCMGAIIWCGIGRLVFAASIEQLSAKIGQIMLTAEDVATKSPFAPIDVAGGVLSAEAMALFK
jgi:tRNA(adenine34) deaminase